MKVKSNEVEQVAKSEINGVSPRPLYTLRKFAERNSNFTTLSAITNQHFKSRPRFSTSGIVPGNGMHDFGVFVRIGRRVLVDEEAYFRWLHAQQNGDRK
ncbi:hypothetical protein SAMN05216404_103298 [Nitrosospira multiformis]|uniref:Uncharacterized protein n=1 Tax=Nitrosospira multiformis TaxID=1231 RepID=A0A1H8FDF5_9PROT|nr:hypothetical protein [Nitrosospira multiformis]SEN29739.1 hypothetical protein SAMN05216404_103298 [Nitrosospira multiformis]